MRCQCYLKVFPADHHGECGDDLSEISYGEVKDFASGGGENNNRVKVSTK